MIQTFSKIFTNILTAIYEPFGFAILLSLLFMFFWLYAKEHGLKHAFLLWIKEYKESLAFRKTLLLTFYTTMILFRTLLNRNLWVNPLSDVMGGWTLHNSNGDFTTEPIENLMLFIPFILLLLWTLRDKIIPNVKFLNTLWQSTKITFLFSLSIEFLQLLLRLGTFQLSDLFYNTLGGTSGGIIYYIIYRIVHRKKNKA